jgi:hypothetical protein
MTLQRWLARVQSDTPTGTQPPLPQFTEIKLSAPIGNTRWAAELCRSGGWTLRLAHDVPSALVEQLLRLC